MKKSIIFLSILSFLLCLSCDRLDGLDEGDRNTYTWKGTILDKYSNTPLANASLYLQVDYKGIPIGNSEILAESTTDSEGYFSITYRRIKKASEGIGLFVDHGSFSSLPIYTSDANTNVDQTFSTIRHSRISLGFDSDLGHPDSIIIAPLGLAESGSTRFNADLEPANDGKFLLFDLKKHPNISQYFKCDVVAIDPATGANNWLFNYYFGLKDLRAAQEADTIKNSDYQIKKYQKHINIFPITDSILIKVSSL